MCEPVPGNNNYLIQKMTRKMLKLQVNIKIKESYSIKLLKNGQRHMQMRIFSKKKLVD